MTVTYMQALFQCISIYLNQISFSIIHTKVSQLMILTRYVRYVRLVRMIDNYSSVKCILGGLEQRLGTWGGDRKHMLLGEETDYRRGHVTDAGLSCHPFSFFSFQPTPPPGIFSRTTDVFVRKMLERNYYIGGSLHALDGRRER